MPRKPKYRRHTDYTGGKLWRVIHPDFGAVEVLAPSNPAAIVVASEIWGQRWQSMDFYARCFVQFVGRRTPEVRHGE